VRGAGRLDVQRRFVSKARVALAKLLAELRLCTAAVVLTTHAWRVELGELGRRRQWPAHARLALLRRADREVWLARYRRTATATVQLARRARALTIRSA
jgi:hypothetical protein